MNLTTNRSSSDPQEVGGTPKRARVLDSFPQKDDAPISAKDGRPVVEFRRRGTKDDYVVFPYSGLVWVNYAASYGIILHFASHTVYIKGTSLEPIYEGLREQTLRWVHESEGNPASRNEPTVEHIFIRQHSAGDSMFRPLQDQELEPVDA